VKNSKKKIVGVVSAALAAMILLGGAGCTSDADNADENIKTAAEQFEVQRTIVGMNGITGKTIFYAEGRCSFERPDGGRFDLVCKYGPNDFRKQTFLMGDQDEVVITQEHGIDVSVYHTRIILKPENLLPEFDLEVGKQ
jgi:hypothetical protein